jgi:3-dehydroquinate synthetase
MHTHLIRDRGSVVSTIEVGRDMDERLVAAVGDDRRRRIAVLCQSATFDLAMRYANVLVAAGYEATGYSLPDGEAAKRMSVVEEVYRHLNGRSFTRDDLVVGVGGGSLTDVTGFVGGTYLRGIPVVYVPTTLLGAVDAAIGGKTGVNVDGKNLAGVFRHPRAVVVDVDTIDALPQRLRIEGAAEALKTGFIADMDIVEAYERAPLDPDLEDVVNRSIAVKAAVVNEDFTEQGRRAILNYGHTVGHAIETATGRSHGASVSIGMVAAAAASARHLGFTGADRQISVLDEVGLPTAAADAPAATVRSVMALDKKRDHSGLRMVLLRGFARPEVVTVDDATVQAALDAIGVG